MSKGQQTSMTAERFAALPADIRALRLHVALNELVQLSSHYAELLNMHDGGERRPFENADAWIIRLYETGTLPPRDGAA